MKQASSAATSTGDNGTASQASSPVGKTHNRSSCRGVAHVANGVHGNAVRPVPLEYLADIVAAPTVDAHHQRRNALIELGKSAFPSRQVQACMAVNIPEAWSDEQSVDVERFSRHDTCRFGIADKRDRVTGDADILIKPGISGAIQYFAIDQEEVDRVAGLAGEHSTVW